MSEVEVLRILITNYSRQKQNTCILLFLLHNTLYLAKPTTELFMYCIYVYTCMYIVIENVALRNRLPIMYNYLTFKD
jgi:hypothetical protein